MMNLPPSWKENLVELLQLLIEAIPDSAMILDEDRNVLLVNKLMLEKFNLTREQVLGNKPGVVLGCLFATESTGGCGTGAHCTVCGALKAVLLCNETGNKSVEECQLVLEGDEGGSLDLEVTATFSEIENTKVTLFVLKDVSDEKRRSVLERLFFHDVLNMVGGIHGMAQLLTLQKEIPVEQEEVYKKWVLDLSGRLIDEITHQRRIMAAERGDFTPDFNVVKPDELLKEVQALYSTHDVAEGKKIEISGMSGCSIISDASILHRLLGNLLKNALEAVPVGSTVTLSCRDLADVVEFSVHNPGEMPESVQLQMFRRSFSTKSPSGRGLGTYSVKLFGERYLKGRVDFSSSADEGTLFRFTLPKNQ